MPRRHFSLKATERRFLICHWNDRALGVAVQLTAPVLLQSERIHLNVLADASELTTCPVPKFLSERLSGRVHFVAGEPDSPQDLKRAGLAEAESVLLVSPDGDPAEADARTLLTLNLLRRLASDPEGPCPRVILELRSRSHLAKAETLRGLCLQQGLAVEMLRTWEIQTRVFSQAARSPGLSRVYLNLLTFSEDTAEPYRLPLPEPDGNWRLSFFRLARWCLRLRNSSVPTGHGTEDPGLVLPVGILRPEGSVVSPLRCTTDDTVRAKDELLCFARSLKPVRALGRALTASWQEILRGPAPPADDAREAEETMAGGPETGAVPSEGNRREP